MTRPELKLPMRCSTVKRWRERVVVVVGAVATISMLAIWPLLLVFPPNPQPLLLIPVIVGAAFGSIVVWVILIVLVVEQIWMWISEHAPRITCIKDEGEE
jgi:hypothetical protein